MNRRFCRDGYHARIGARPFHDTCDRTPCMAATLMSRRDPIADVDDTCGRHTCQRAQADDGAALNNPPGGWRELRADASSKIAQHLENVWRRNVTVRELETAWGLATEQGGKNQRLRR